MPRYIRARAAGGTFFFTVVTHQRQKIFSAAENRAKLRKAISRVRKEFPFAIEAWVMLPDHLHCLWTLPDGDSDFSKRWALIKLWFSRESDNLPAAYDKSEIICSSQGDSRKIWQKRFWEHLIRDEDDFRNHFDYIHFNPVRHGLVRRVRDWPFSTFHRFVRSGVYPENWGEEVMVNLDGVFGE